MKQQNEEKKNKKFNFKNYIKEFLVFADKNLIKVTGILTLISIVIIALSIKTITNAISMEECEGACRDGITLFSSYYSKIQVLFVIAFAGIVPYMYAPYVGFAVGILSEVYSLAYIIKGYGALLGIGIGIVPLILNVLIICLITSLGVYICRTLTVGYKISNLKNMNFNNFKIELYKSLNKKDKVEQLTKQKENKLNKLENKKDKLKYLQILNTAIVVCVLQFVSVLIQEILL